VPTARPHSAPSLPGSHDRSLEFGGTEVELHRVGSGRRPCVAADQVKAAGPSLVGALGRAIHAIHHAGKGKVQPAEAERGMILFSRQGTGWSQRDSLP
jgi:hypothetical protein